MKRRGGGGGARNSPHNKRKSGRWVCGGCGEEEGEGGSKQVCRDHSRCVLARLWGVQYCVRACVRGCAVVGRLGGEGGCSVYTGRPRARAGCRGIKGGGGGAHVMLP